eukprot:214091_1
MTSDSNCNIHVADANAEVFKNDELNNPSGDFKHKESEQKNQILSIINTSNGSNHSTDNEDNQITTNDISTIVDDTDNDDEEDIKDDHSIVKSSVTKPRSHRSKSSNTQIFNNTDTNTTPSFDYWFVLYVSLIFLSVGFIIYIFTSIAWIVLLFSAVGFTVSVTYEYIQYTNAKQQYQ